MQIEITIEVPLDSDPIGLKQDINRALIQRTPVKIRAWGTTHMVVINDVREV